MAPSTDQIKKNSRRGGKPVKLICLGCFRKKPFDGIEYDDYPQDPYVTVISASLTTHLNTSETKGTKCFQAYKKNHHKQSPTTRKNHYNLTGSVIVEQEVPMEELGLPTTFEGDEYLHRSLNNQTIYHHGLDIEKSVVDSMRFTTTQRSPILPTDTSDDETIPEEIDGDDDITICSIPFNEAILYSEDQINDQNTDQIKPNDQIKHPPNHTPDSGKAPKFIVDSTKPKFTVVPSDERILVELDLMNIMAQHKMSLAAFNSIWRWANRSQERKNFCFSKCPVPRKRQTMVGDISKLATDTDTSLDEFKQKCMKWVPSKKIVPIYMRDFRSVLKSLLTNTSLVKEGNFSFPDPKVPYIWNDFPEPSNETIITELHHGHWWVRTWQDSFTLKDKLSLWNDEEVKDILVPVIFYMDGISLDANGRLSLMPLNMTLGIFNTEVRKRAEAWETIYFHPNDTVVQLAHNAKKDSQPPDKCQNLHNGLDIALESFLQACTGDEVFEWKGLPYGGKLWTVRMKFAIAFVVGDTELHDKLCGRKNAYSKTPILCRHCTVDKEYIVNPLQQLDANNREARLWKPEDFDVCKPQPYFDDRSHHRIKNVFDKHYFGRNPHKIHLATPGELLHMHQLGVAKRAVESYKAHVNHDFNSTGQSKENLSYLELSKLAQTYGAYLSRQSDRNFPRTKFSSVHILRSSMKEASHYSGIIISILLSLVSTHGKACYTGRYVGLTEMQRCGLIKTLELILGMEEFLKQGGISIGDLPGLKLVVDDFLTLINENCKRTNNATTGYGCRTVKNHLYLHIETYIRYWGIPTGFDSSFSESNHKTEIKAPSMNTQRRATEVIKQTGKRQYELRLIREAARHFKLTDLPDDKPPEVHPRYGPTFTIFVDKDTKKPRMVWDEKRRRGQPTHNQSVLQHCVDKVLPLVKGDTLRGFTEHQRMDPSTGIKYIYRAHPSYRSNTGLKSSLWYDWAMFNVDQGLPGQINLFLEIQQEDFIDNKAEETNGYHCVVREFNEHPMKIESSSLVTNGKISADNFILRDCDYIADDIAVVPNILKRCEEHDQYVTGNDFFVVGNRNAWLQMFLDKIETKKGGDKRKHDVLT